MAAVQEAVQMAQKEKMAKMQWRVILDKENTAFHNMATDEAIMRLFPENKMPTVRLYAWKPCAVSIGYFQSLLEEVDVSQCEKQGVDIVRRITGGGAVFHEHELTYSIALPEKGVVPQNILESYAKICNAVVLGLAELGLNCQFVPLNDIAINGKKISGNAQTRRNGVILQHGTVLLKVDVEKMFSLLKVPNEKLKGKLIEDVKQRVTSVEIESGGSVSFADCRKAMRKGFAENFGVGLEEGGLLEKKKSLAEKIAKEKFSGKDWNYKR